AATAPSPPTVPTAFVQAALLNLRSGPGTDFDVVSQVAAGVALPITGSHPDWPDWWHVTHQEAGGWVYAPLVTTGGPMDQVPLLADGALPVTPDIQTTAASAETGDSGAENSPPVAELQSAPLPDPALEPLRPTLSR